MRGWDWCYKNRCPFPFDHHFFLALVTTLTPKTSGRKLPPTIELKSNTVKRSQRLYSRTQNSIDIQIFFKLGFLSQIEFSTYQALFAYSHHFLMKSFQYLIICLPLDDFLFSGVINVELVFVEEDLTTSFP